MIWSNRFNQKANYQGVMVMEKWKKNPYPPFVVLKNQHKSNRFFFSLFCKFLKSLLHRHTRRLEIKSLFIDLIILQTLSETIAELL